MEENKLTNEANLEMAKTLKRFFELKYPGQGFAEEISLEKKRSGHTVKKSLYQMLDNYKAPDFTIEEYNTKTRKTKERLDIYFQEMELHHSRQDIPFNNPWKTAARRKEEDVLKMKDGTVKGYNYFTKTYDKTPLEYPGEAELSSFVDEIRHYGDSDNLALAETLKHILCKAEKLGFSMKTLSQLLGKFIVKYLPHMKQSSDDSDPNHPAQRFEICVEAINEASEIEKIKAARLAIKRNPGDSVQYVLQTYCSLIKQHLKILNPKITSEVLNVNAEKLTKNVIPDIVTPAIYKKFDHHCNQEYLSGQTIGLVDYIRIIQDLENENIELRPKTTLSPTTLNDFSLKLETGITKNTDEQIANVNYVSSGRSSQKGYRGRYRSNSRSGDRGQTRYRNGSRNRYSSRDRNRNNGFESRRSTNYRSQSRSPYRSNRRYNKERRNDRSRNRFRSESRERYRSSSRTRYPSRDRRNRNSRTSSRDKSQTPIRDGNPSTNNRYPRPPSRSSRDRDLRQSSRSPAQSRPHQPHQQDRDRRSRTPTKKNESDKYKNTNRNRSSSVHCAKCGKNHASSNCWIYQGYTETFCNYCFRKNNQKYFHTESQCKNKSRNYPN